MWMMGYNEASDFNLQDSFNGRKLRPLIPRPTPSSSSHRPHDLLAFNHHMASMNEQSKREFNTQQVIVSSRWNPTTEQLQMLEDLYRRGTRTPSTEEIQEITAQLRRYGKIEGKNVFYWFQNHKARERQKRRRQLESAAAANDHQLNQPFDQTEENEKKEYSGGPNRSTGFEAEQGQAKNWPPPTNCTTHSQRTVSIQEAAKTVGAAASEFRADGWIQFNEGELHQRRTLAERNATWQQMMQLSCSSHINYTTSTISPTIMRSTLDPKPTQKHPQQHHLNNIFINPKISTSDHHDHLNYFFAGIRDHVDNEIAADYDGNYEKSQTLQLFPLRSEDTNGDDHGNGDNWEKDSLDNPNFPMVSIKNLTPNNQFFEFLPLKN